MHKAFLVCLSTVALVLVSASCTASSHSEERLTSTERDERVAELIGKGDVLGLFDDSFEYHEKTGRTDYPLPEAIKSVLASCCRTAEQAVHLFRNKGFKISNRATVCKRVGYNEGNESAHKYEEACTEGDRFVDHSNYRDQFDELFVGEKYVDHLIVYPVYTTYQIRLFVRDNEVKDVSAGAFRDGL